MAKLFAVLFGAMVAFGFLLLAVAAATGNQDGTAFHLGGGLLSMLPLYLLILFVAAWSDELEGHDG